MQSINVDRNSNGRSGIVGVGNGRSRTSRRIVGKNGIQGRSDSITARWIICRSVIVESTKAGYRL